MPFCKMTTPKHTSRFIIHSLSWSIPRISYCLHLLIRFDNLYERSNHRLKPKPEPIKPTSLSHYPHQNQVPSSLRLSILN
jgi:hypothetical protein